MAIAMPGVHDVVAPPVNVSTEGSGALDAGAVPPPSAVRWWLATLPLAPLAAAALLFSEWLFEVTKPSSTSALPFDTQIRVLLTAFDARIVLCLLSAQLCASSVSLVRYPSVRSLALWPAAGVGGMLLLLLIDNFTYTLFGIGIARAGTVLRAVYAAVLVVLVFAVWAKLASNVVERAHGVAWPIVAAAVSLLFIGAPRVWTEPDRGAPVASSLPPLTSQAATARRPNILFLGVDGLDASLTSAYGYERPTTPFLEAFAHEALVFENAFSNASRTHGALVTLLTGRSPFSTHVTFPPTILQGDDSARTLPMVLKTLGYSTLQIGMRHYADAEDTNLRGFDAANYRWQRLEDIDPTTPVKDDAEVFRTLVAERISERLSRIFLGSEVADGFAHVEGRAVVPQWQDARRVETLREYFARAPGPWFVHAHLLDTHCCVWRPNRMQFQGGSSRAVDARDSQIRESDENLRLLVEGLAASGQLDRTIVVISSDHGSGWKSTERIPLMIRFPGRAHAGRVVQNVQLADVAPTVLSFLGVTPPEWMDGEALVPGRLPSPSRPIFAVSEVQAYSGPAGARVLKNANDRNFGVAGVMAVVGPDMFEWNLETGEFMSRRWREAEAGDVPVTEQAARRLLGAEVARAGMVAGGSAAVTTAPDGRPSLAH